MTDIIIRQGREKPIVQGHPWIFSGAIARVDGDPAPGEIVTVRGQSGDFMARGYWNARSQIQVRLLTWRDEAIDEAWWRAHLARALDARYPYNQLQRAAPRTEGYRLVNAENDFLPGLIVDRYGDWLVLQALTLHIDQRKTQIAAWLTELCAERSMPVRGVYERSDVDVRSKEGIRPANGVLTGEAPPEYIELGNERLRYLVDVRRGHKTGTYLDQKHNHHLLADLCDAYRAQVAPPRLLNLFSYTGRFGLGIDGHVTHVDASLDALELAERNAMLSGVPAHRTEFVQADVFDYLRDQATAGESYDIIVLDPPKFAHNKQQVEKASRGYKDINLNAFRLVRPGGYLMTFSCSGAVDRDLFQKIVFGALADSGRQGQTVRYLSANDDHPTALTFPEGEYLKGLLVRVY